MPPKVLTDRPPGFQLAGAWQEVVEEMERRRSLLPAIVLIDAGLVHVLRALFGRHCEVLDELDGRARVRIAAPTARTIAEQVAGFGAHVEVLEPEPVRAELARIGAELVGRYA